MATATKSNTASLEWTDLPFATAITTNDISLSTSFKGGIAVTVAHGDGTANALGVNVIIDAKFAADPDEFRTIYELRMAAGTATANDLAVAATNGDNTIQLTSSASFNNLGQAIFIYDGSLGTDGATEDSEIVHVQSDDGANVLGLASPIAIAPGPGHVLATVVTTDPVTKYFPIPDEISNIRVRFINDDADADMVVRVDLAKLTTVS